MDRICAQLSHIKSGQAVCLLILMITILGMSGRGRSIKTVNACVSVMYRLENCFIFIKERDHYMTYDIIFAILTSSIKLGKIFFWCSCDRKDDTTFPFSYYLLILWFCKLRCHTDSVDWETSYVYLPAGKYRVFLRTLSHYSAAQIIIAIDDLYFGPCPTR